MIDVMSAAPEDVVKLFRTFFDLERLRFMPQRRAPRMHASRASLLGAVLPFLGPLHCAAENALAPDLSKIGDGAAWTVINTDPVTTVDEGKAVVRLDPRGGDRPSGSNVAMALVHGVDFVEGAIDVDLKGLGSQQRSFLGVAFGVESPNEFEAVYFRPFNFAPDDPAHRVRAVQYVAWPDHPWEELRTHTPDLDEAPIDPVPNPAGWFHAHVEVTETKVSVFVEHASKPCLVADRLRAHRRGGVGLFVDSHAGSFARLTIEAFR
jgi:hypothetical protein